jgi:hypothetical protein
MKAKILLAVLMMGISSCVLAQSGEIRGKVFDENREPLFGVNVSVIGGMSNSGASTNFDGEFIIKPLSPGLYTVEISFMGYNTVNIVGVNVFNNKITFLDNVYLNIDAIMGKQIDIVAPKVDPISKDEPQKITITGDVLIKTPGTKNPVVMARSFQSDIQGEGNQMIVRGSRPGASAVIVDGIKVRDEMSTIPSAMIGSMEIYTGGIPAKYGDVTGGVIIINTKNYFDMVNERRARESMQ